MQNFDASIPVEELIKRYHRELMELKERRQAILPSLAEIPETAQQNSLDEQFPVPDVQRDLQNLRRQQTADNDFSVTPEQAEDNAVREELQGQSETGAQVPPAQPQQGVPGFPLSPEEQEILPPSAPPPMEMSLGYLRAFVTTGRGALPVPNAQVIVTRVIDDEELLEQAARSDVSGYTPLFTLPAVSSLYSQVPGNASPYTYYTIYVRADGFYPVRLRNVPMYGGITAVQPVDLVPVAEGDDPNRERTITEGAPENLL